MKNKYIIPFAISFFAIFLFSCDKVEQPIKDGKNPWVESTTPEDTVTPEVPIRKILVEDFTGHLCGNCPRAAENILELKSTYGDHIIPIAIHVGAYATPISAPFDADYNTAVGDELDSEYGPANAGLPAGIINRQAFDGSIIQSWQQWSADVNGLLVETEDASIGITIENTFDESSRKVDTKITANILADFSENLNVCVYFVEDSIVSAQKDYSLTPDLVDNYVHRHLLRKAVNGAFGTELAFSATQGEEIIKEFSFVADENWDMSHGEIVAFITYADTKEVIQAESEHVISNH